MIIMVILKIYYWLITFWGILARANFVNQQNQIIIYQLGVFIKRIPHIKLISSYLEQDILEMDRPARRTSLHMIEHKNREQILLYISQAKIQIYSHCIIAYNPKFFIDLQKTYDIAELYKNNQSIQGYDDFKIIRKQSEEYGQSINIQNNQIAEQQQNRKKSTDSEQCKSKQKQYSQLFNSETMLKQSSPQIQYTQQISQKIVHFNNPDLAFYYDETTRTIQIINLTQKKIELCFSVENQQILLSVITLFRRKLCEMGFMKKYKIIKLIGKGATADVHLVQRICDKKLFAAKIISIKNSNQKQFELFVNEAKLLRILKHKNVIHLESVYIHKKQLIQVLQYLPGGNLLQLVKKNQVNSSSEKWRALKDITTGLQFLRQRRIVHRDLKLQNILIRNNSVNREYVISDFGLACWSGQKCPVYERCGTPGYIAPQILNLSKGASLLDHKCDIFSLGVIAHLIFLHEPLFHYKGSLKDLIQRNKKADFNLNDKIYNRFSMHELNFLTLTLQKRIEDRPNSEALLKLLNSLSPSTSYRSPQKSKRKISFELQNTVEVQEKKQICLTKKAIKIDLNSIKQSNRKNSYSCTDDASPTRISLVDSARKAMNNLWTFLASPSKKSQKMKLKQNSIQKQRKLSDFLNQ